MRRWHRPRGHREGGLVTITMGARHAVAAGAAALMLALAGCATAPVRPAAQWLGVLPDDANLYLSLDVPASADVIQAALATASPDVREIGPLLQRMSRLYAAVILGEGSPPRLSAIALGSFPAGMIRSKLCGSKAWDTVKSPPGKYYTNVKSGLQVSVPGPFAVLISAGSMDGLLARFAMPEAPALPPEVADDMETADLLLFLPELPGGLGGAAGTGAATANLPIREVWLEAHRDGDRYLVSGTCNTASERDARSVVLLVKLGLVQWLRSQNLSDVSERLKTITVTADGQQVKLAGLAFGKDELVPVLLGMAGLSGGGIGAASP
jgi:hypothetical protein